MGRKPISLAQARKHGEIYDEPVEGDHYTFVHPDGSYLGMNAAPFHPAVGIAQHGEGITAEWRQEREQYRVTSEYQWRQLPLDVRQCIAQEISSF